MPYVHYEYSYDFGSSEAVGEGVFAVLGALLIVYLLLIAFAVAVYVLQSLGFYTIAKRRGIHNPWLAWLPIGNMWILGSISDQYQYVVKGRVRSRRKLLLWLMIGTLLAEIPAVIAYAATMINVVSESPEQHVFMSLGMMMLFFLLTFALAITATVFEYIALYDLYVSCDPNNGVLYLVLSVLFSVTMPFFVFACRKKDQGMPPRRDAVPKPVIPAPGQQPPWRANPGPEPPVNPPVLPQFQENRPVETPTQEPEEPETALPEAPDAPEEEPSEE